MAQNAKGPKGQGHMSRSPAKVTQFHTALCMVVINMLKKFDDDATARFCCMREQSKRRKKKPRQPLQ